MTSTRRPVHGAAAGGAAVLNVAATCATGTRRVKVLPRPGPSLWASIDPPCISIRCRASASPMPRPVCERCAVGVVLREQVEDTGQHLLGDARPRVRDAKDDLAPRRVAGDASSAEMLMCPPGSVNLTALCSTFETPGRTVRDRTSISTRVLGHVDAEIDLPSINGRAVGLHGAW